ncbi:manganese/zinc/iron transport system ATP- binding protein [Rubricella aquisinus]|uniref:Manganese/zinc/iron transport system ATP-binding protein n=1 Tax=Rubricella aquisinus TaxID=2028108 RepID=A0A840X5H0_9RHOB|nr:metal ABC transporter ATP-binding protein [Rubricella aquisinus]MBB5517036.1 manganese/zinc/iron transport system ATP- binding protein [Rubricella aquisinus]
MSIPALTLKGVTVSYGGRPAVFSVDVTFPIGSMTAIIGPNGAGKSTLLKGALGIVPLLAGEARFFGLSYQDARRRVAYVPQRASVDWDFPARVIDVVMMGLYAETGFLRLFRQRHRDRAMECLSRVGMDAFAERQIGALSGGQQQRVFLARALAEAGELYILDEPFAGVDAATERAIIAVLKDLKAEGRTIIAVHHDLSTVPDYFDRVVLLNRERIADGPLEEAFTQTHLQSAYGGRLAAGQVADLAARVG